MNYTTIKSIFNEHLLNFTLPKPELTFLDSSKFLVDNAFEACDMIGFQVTTVNNACVCNRCNEKAYSKGWRSKFIYYAIYNNKPVVFELKYRRFVCRTCTKYFSNQSIPTIGQKSVKICDMIIEQFREKETFAKVSRQYKLSKSKIKPIDYTQIEAIGIDENRLLSVKEKYQTVIIDHKNNSIIEILPNRYKTDVTKWLDNKEFKEGISVTQDMWKPFEDAVRASLTNPVIIADCFHFARQGMWAFNRSRINTQKNEGFKTNKYWKTLNIRYTKLNEEGKQKLFKILLSSRELLKAYLLKEQFLKMVCASSPVEYYKAENKFLYLIKKYSNAEFEKVIATLINWRVPILNMVRNRDLSNGAVERINRDLKQLRNISFGLKNLERLNKRAKLLIN